MNAKNVLFAAMIFSVATAGAYAATPVQNNEGLNKMGSVSASGATLSALEKQLARKAQEAGASSYQIVSAGGENKLHGVAVIYR